MIFLCQGSRMLRRCPGLSIQPTLKHLGHLVSFPPSFSVHRAIIFAGAVAEVWQTLQTWPDGGVVVGRGREAISSSCGVESWATSTWGDTQDGVGPGRVRARPASSAMRSEEKKRRQRQLSTGGQGESTAVLPAFIVGCTSGVSRRLARIGRLFQVDLPWTVPLHRSFSRRFNRGRGPVRDCPTNESTFYTSSTLGSATSRDNQASSQSRPTDHRKVQPADVVSSRGTVITVSCHLGPCPDPRIEFILERECRDGGSTSPATSTARRAQVKLSYHSSRRRP